MLKFLILLTKIDKKSDTENYKWFGRYLKNTGGRNYFLHTDSDEVLD